MNKILNRDHILVHAAYQAMNGIVFGFGVYSLMERGFNSAESGLIMSVFNVISFIFQPILSNYLDADKEVSLFEANIMLGIGSVILFVVNYFIRSSGLFLAVVFIASGSLFGLMQPLVNSYSYVFNNVDFKVNFSSARAIGSCTYATVCLVFGQLTNVYPYTIVLIGGIAFAISMLLSSILIRFDFMSTSKEVIEEKGETVSFKEFINNHKLFIYLCIAVTCLYVGYRMIDCFMLLVVERVGGTSADMGSCLAFKAYIEGLFIFLFPLFLKKFKLQNIIKFSAIMFIVKSFIITIAPNIFVLYVAQSFQSLSFALLLPSLIEYVNNTMNKKEAIRGHAFNTMTLGLGSILSSLLAGFISNVYGTFSMEIVSLIITIVSALTIVFIISKDKTVIKKSK